MGRAWSWSSTIVLLHFVAAAPAHADPINTGWAQPGGPGSPVTVTYSYSNLLDAGFNTTLSAGELRRSTELAFGVWSRYAPIHFVETADSGPSPTDNEYNSGGDPDIRIGYQPSLSTGSAAFAYFPLDRFGSVATGLGGDIQFNNDLTAFHVLTWGQALDGPTALDFFSVVLHEIGHSLGIAHIFDESAIMSGTTVTVFTRQEDADLRPADIRAIRALYGEGFGSVHPLLSADPTPEPGAIVLVATGLAVAVRRMRRWHGLTRFWVTDRQPAR
jgi:matrixin